MYICLITNKIGLMSRFIACLFLLVLLTGCTKDVMDRNIQLDLDIKRQISSFSPDGSYTYYILPDEGDLASLPQDQRNLLSPEKVALGKMLFYETGLATGAKFESGIGTYSCGSCHLPTAGMRPGAPQGVADGGMGYGVNGENRLRLSEYNEDDLDVQSARPLSLINVAYVTNTFWNGQFGGEGSNIGTEDVWDLREDTRRNALGYKGVETVNFAGIITHRILINKELLDQYGYTEMFDRIFPEFEPEERYTQFVASLALSAYLRSIVSDQAPFQKWLKGDMEAMSKQEKLGASLFFGKARCANCHYEKNLGSNEFHALGVKDIYQRPSYSASEDDRRNLGRGGFTLKEEDNYKFRVPQLYNMGDAPFYFHGASKTNLEELLEYKIIAQSENPKISNDRLSEKFLPIDLNQEEKDAVLAFLNQSLRDPNLKRYMPEYVLSGQCFPNNDFRSRVDLGCN